jgi:hypothetical protein
MSGMIVCRGLRIYKPTYLLHSLLLFARVHAKRNIKSDIKQSVSKLMKIGERHTSVALEHCKSHLYLFKTQDKILLRMLITLVTEVYGNKQLTRNENIGLE